MSYKSMFQGYFRNFEEIKESSNIFKNKPKKKKQYVRWSLDVRYEATHNATGLGKKFGFIAASKKRQNITKELTWIKKSQR